MVTAVPEGEGSMVFLASASLLSLSRVILVDGIVAAPPILSASGPTGPASKEGLGPFSS